MLKVNEHSVGPSVLFSERARRFHVERLLPGLRFWTLTAALALSITLGCGTTHATLDIAVPPNATAGVPFSITVTALYEGQPDTVINSAITFTSSDPAASLPGYTQFTLADAGTHTWANGVTLRTPGQQTISASIVMATGINGTADVQVSAASPTDQR